MPDRPTSDVVIEAARAYRARGWSVFPINDANKKAMVKWKALQTSLASAEDFSFWFGGFPGRFRTARIAIATGAFNGLFVLDADSEEAIQEVLRRGISDTPTVRTRRGQHWYLRYNPERPLRNTDHLGTSGKIDARGEGGLVVAPPTPTRKWIVSPDEVALAPIPEWVYDLYDERHFRTKQISFSINPLALVNTMQIPAPTAPAVPSLAEAPPLYTSPEVFPLEEEWRDRVHRIAKACARHTDSRHALYLALSGELCWIAVANEGAYLPLEGDRIERLVEAVRRTAHPDWTRDTGVKDTIQRVLHAGVMPKGLREQFPDVYFIVRDTLRLTYLATAPLTSADALDQATRGAKKWMHDLAHRLEPLEIERALRQRVVDDAQARLEDPTNSFLSRDEIADRKKAYYRALDAQAAPPEAPRRHNVFALSAECGAGKTLSSSQLAVYLAETRGCKVAIAVHSNERAIALCRENLDGKAGHFRYFGATSILPTEDWDAKQAHLPVEERPPQSLTGLEACIHHPYAKAFVNGGQNLHRLVCLGGCKNESEAEDKGKLCSAFKECRVRAGKEEVRLKGQEPRIAVGNFSTLEALLEWLGEDGILIIDEPPSLLESIELKYTHLQIALAHTTDLESKYTQYMFSVLRNMIAFRGPGEGAEQTVPMLTTDWMRSIQSDVPFRVRDALPEEWNGTAPPIKREILEQIRSPIQPRETRITHAHRLSITSRTYKTLYELADQAQIALADDEHPQDALPLDAKATLRYVPNLANDGMGSVVLTRMYRALEKALTRPTKFNPETGIGGATFLLDANYRSNAAIYAKVLGYAPEVKHFAVGDAGPAHRTWVEARASRTKLLEHGRPQPDAIALLIKEVVQPWMETGPPDARYGFISFLPIVLLLRRIQEGIRNLDGDGDPPEQWNAKDWGSLDELAQAIRTRVGDDFFWRIPLTGYFHAVKGSNAFQTMHGIITFGDPRPNVGSCRHEVDWLGLSPEEGEKLVTLRCEDELEQAQGRLRTVRRATESRSLHVGRVRPGGTGWSKVDAFASFVDVGGRPSTEAAMTKEEFRALAQALGGIPGVLALLAAKNAGVSRSQLFKFQNGDHAVPQKIAEILRSAPNSTSSA